MQAAITKMPTMSEQNRDSDRNRPLEGKAMRPAYGNVFILAAWLLVSTYAFAAGPDSGRPEPAGIDTNEPVMQSAQGKPAMQADIEKLQHRVRLSNIGAPAPAASAVEDKTRDELAVLIARIRSITNKPRQIRPEQAKKAVQAVFPAGTETNKTASVQEPPEAPEAEDVQPQTEPNLPYIPVTEDTLKLVAALSQDPNQLQKPFELAELLFQSGNLTQAAKCYEKSLEYLGTDPALAQMRAWILFQTGNCLRILEPQKAKKFYATLITEQPNCLWSDLAKARVKIIDWRLRDRPRTLIEESK